MPTTATPLGGFTAPTDTDPVENGAAQIRSLAAQLDKLVKIKGADSIKNNSAVLGNVTDMSFPVVNGKKYAFRMVLFCSAASSTPDLSLALTFPVGTCCWTVLAPELASVSNATTLMKVAHLVAAASGATISAGVPAGTAQVIVEGTFIANANGTVQLQFAQNTANASDSKINAGSLLNVQLAA